MREPASTRILARCVLDTAFTAFAMLFSSIIGSIDTLPIIDENNIAKAVNAVSRTHRASILVLAGSLMGGKIAQEVMKLQNEGFKVIALNMAGSVPDVADLVVTDPVQAGTFAVMAIAKTASFDLDRVSGRRF